MKRAGSQGGRNQVVGENRRPWLILVIAFFAIGCIAAEVSAERWYGNIVLGALHNSSSQPLYADEGDNYQAHANLNVEDVLFYKNRVRLAANLDWKHQGDGQEQYRPIYFFDLFGYGYTFNSTYSRYRYQGQLLASTELVDVYTRDWRNMLQIAPIGFPTLNLLYSQIRTFNNEPYQINNQRQRSLIAQATFARPLYSVRGVHQRMRTDDYGTKRENDLNRTSSGNLALSAPSSKIGSVSMTYNYFDTRRTLAGSPLSKGKTHSLTGMASTVLRKTVTASVSYSGQFTTNKVLTNPKENRRNEVISGSIGYAPTGYLEFQAVKGYQLDGGNRQYDISEYVTLQASLSRYIRQGVDTRVSATRTIFQQGNRSIEYRDTVGNLDSLVRIDHYYIDTYYGSVALSPVPYLKLSQGLSITRDSHPVLVNRRWLMSATTDTRMWLRDNLEGRVSYSNVYQGDRLRIGHLSGETYNIGASWTPLRNASVAVAYIHSIFNTTIRNTSNSLSIYSSYAYRRVYNVSIAYNSRGQSIGSDSTSGQSTTPSVEPKSVNAQLLIYTSARSTLTIGYTWARNAVGLAEERTTTTWRANLNLQI